MIKIIDTINDAPGNYRQHTMRNALDAAIRSDLTAAGKHMVISAPDVAVRQLQILVRQVIPDGWEITTKRQPDDALKIWRLE